MEKLEPLVDVPFAEKGSCCLHLCLRDCNDLLLLFFEPFCFFFFFLRLSLMLVLTLTLMLVLMLILLMVMMIMMMMTLTILLGCLLLVFGCCVVGVGHCFCLVVMRSCCTWSVVLFPHIKFPATPKRNKGKNQVKKRYITCLSIWMLLQLYSRFGNSLITWVLTSWETWRNSRQRIVKQHPWRLLEQQWPPWLPVGGRWGQISRRCVRCAAYHGIPPFLVDVGEMMNSWIYIRGHGFLDPDLREEEFAVMCPLHSMLGTYALQKSGPETDLGATNCNRRYWQIVLFVCLPL